MESVSQAIDPKIMEWDSYWQPYQITLKENWKDLLLALNGSSWPVKNFLKSAAKARGVLHIVEICNNVILIAPEIVSRSASTRGMFRILIFENFAFIQVEEDNISSKIFTEYFSPVLELEEENIKEIRINAMRIRNLAKKITPIKLTLLVNNQTAGVDGLEQITLTGKNVLRGIHTLKDRQEVDLKADSIGPWIDIETVNNLRFTMGKGIFFKNEVNSEFFDFMKTALE